MTGTDSQDLGNRGEALVQYLLSVGGISAARLSPDHGEDFLIEVDGARRAPTGEPPLGALLQVKTRSIEKPDDDLALGDIEVKHLLRWSAQQLPVLLVGVGVVNSDEIVYLRSIDDFLAVEMKGRELTHLGQKTMTVHLPRVESLAEEVRRLVVEFHRLAGSDFEGLSPTEVSDNHVEVVARRPGILAWRAALHHWTVLWKSPRRPAFFAAALKELQRQSREAYRGSLRPPHVTFHIYRSLEAVRANTAVARVDWIDPRHVFGPALARRLESPQLRIRPGSESPSLRKFVTDRQASPQAFADIVRKLGPKLDRVAAVLIHAEGAAAAQAAWTPALVETANQLDRGYDAGPGAPAEFEELDRHLQGYCSAIWSHRRLLVEVDDVPDIRRERWTREAIEELEGYYRSWQHLLKATGW